ncbi:uncharacterized protein Nmag_2756 [Natrialba magadii ATCC 43099]|uniref:Uncharacterized protein n=1 Tax=Natrialba magadii (strain ATCC 43099 / DSM 3394 / CCM 3739 / CIP 104546 / IAM 13178 / JCM 8861 / NBRC 102185 / NCIMB 2190 / MS3) TaxID=547559 RepID=D3SZQ2_NATMM|nr:hypothetical protein [Natrialba magadii]ADD06312.1 uncharacterized protein Nmag_2756 [Natrialba magadii ATCC 43099]ELY31251.1 hypothetical protein C500_06606 [Natrialba magadii ATCC 43099]
MSDAVVRLDVPIVDAMALLGASSVAVVGGTLFDTILGVSPVWLGVSLYVVFLCHRLVLAVERRTGEMYRADNRYFHEAVSVLVWTPVVYGSIGSSQQIRGTAVVWLSIGLYASYLLYRLVVAVERDTYSTA